MPELEIEENSKLDVVEEAKLLGVIISSDMSWKSNTANMYKKGFERIWILRRLKKLGVDQHELKDVYRKQILSILELAAPLWTGGITVQERKQLERVQRTALHVILGENFESYYQSLETLQVDPLHNRRMKICQKFALKKAEHHQFRNWFQLNPTKTNNTRSIKNKFVTPYARTKKYENSAIPFLTELLNNTQNINT